MPETHSTRNSNIEALRIIAMLAIILHHYTLYGTKIGTSGVEWQQILNAANLSFGKWGVDVFVLITGFFAGGGRPRRYFSHLTRLWVQAFTTGAILLIVFAVFDRSGLGWKDVVRGVLPITSGTWWFVTIFFVLIALSPVLDHFIRASSQTMQTCAIALMLVFWGIAQYGPGQRFGFSETLLFVELYLIGAYVRQFVPVGQPRRWGWIMGLALTLMALSTAGVQVLSLFWKGASAHIGAFVQDNSPLTILAAVAALCAARALPSRTSGAVNWLASMMFGVYLVHEYPPVRAWMWPKIPGISSALDSPWFPLHALATTLAVFLAATVVEVVRHYVVQQPIMRMLTPALGKLDTTLPGMARWTAAVAQRAANWAGGATNRR